MDQPALQPPRSTPATLVAPTEHADMTAQLPACDPRATSLGRTRVGRALHGQLHVLALMIRQADVRRRSRRRGRRPAGRYGRWQARPPDAVVGVSTAGAGADVG